MVKNYIVFCIYLLLSAPILFAQDGAIKGKITDKTTGESVPFANVVAERGGKLAGGGTTDFDGNYTIKPISPGKYNIKVTFVGYKTILLTDLIVTPDAITFQDLKMASAAEELGVVEVIGYEVPLFNKGDTKSGETVTREDIARMPSRSALGVAATVGGVFQSSNGDINIRGARDAATTIYIDGVKVRGSSGIPQSAIDQISVVTGGIPAKYGDATGGIINITTRGPSETYFGGIELLSSGFYVKGKENKETSIGLDPYGYNLLGFNVSGPLLKIWDKTDSTKKPLLGFFLAGELTHVKDPSPSGIGVWKVKDDVLTSLKSNPLKSTGTGSGSFENTEYIRQDTDLEKVKFKQNSHSQGINLSGKFDVRTGPNINLSFGGQFNWVNGKAYDYGNSMFNYENNGEYTNSVWRAYAKFTQKFNSPGDAEEESKAAVKNAYYQIHVDFTNTSGGFQDATHQDNLFDYGYVGKFTTSTINSYDFGTDSITGYQGMIHNGFQDVAYSFDPSTVNPAASDWTQGYYDLYANDPIEHWENYNQVLDGGGLLNGYRPGDLTTNVYDVWFSPGRVTNSYSRYNTDQYRIIAAGAADFFDNHEISLGFEYEQRTDRAYSVGPVALWRHMRQLTNNHILQLDKNNPIPLYYDLNGEPIFGGVVDYPRLYDGASQALFDYNLRNELGLPTNGTDWIDLNSYAPSTFSINMFSPDELLNNGSSFVSYYGYDYTGEKLSSQPTLDDFFNQIRTVDGYNGPNVYSRNIGAYEPNYVAGYIQDKFAFKDLIFNIGLRIDRFDANQKKLKDPYLLFPAITAGEVRAGGDRGNLNESIPTNIGDDYVVYVDNLENPGQVVGYRNGDKWYNNEGAELANSSSLLTSTGIQPYLQDPDKTEATQISSEAFEDYEPQTTFMPRIAFSFPISDEAMFFAHYDVLSRRPSGATRFNPTQYLFMQNVNDIINNPNLKPSSTVDYELGFQQKLNNFSSLKISVFYKEERDMVQVTKVVDAYPITYTTYGNLDFSTIKGMTVAYDLRRMGNVRLRASYTLQFADGTGSSTQQALAVISAGFPNLKTINALNWDQRHAISTSFDYHYGKGKDYDGPVINFKDKNIKLLEEAGANVVIIGGSGVPYSKQRNITKEGGFASEAAVLDGTLNGSRLPWQVNMDAKLDKYFDLEWGRENKKRASLNVYLQVLNVLNTLNVTGVYGATGNPDDDGYLNDPGAQQGIISLNDEQAFRELYALKVNNPGNFSLPRQIRLGMMLNF